MSEIFDYLNSLNSLGSIPGLDSVKELLERLGNPQKQLNIIHISGTNGKGSTGAFIDGILVAAGYKTGRYSSPPVMDPLEIIRISGKNIEEKEYAEAVFRIKAVCAEMVNDGWRHPTRFEAETACAYLIFREKRVDYAVIECGMGGMYDATNVSDTAVCSVITPVSCDHTAFLGNTVEEIAMHKAGIIKKNCITVTAEQNEGVMDVIRGTSLRNGSELSVAYMTDVTGVKYMKEEGKIRFSYKEFENVETGLIGTYQISNCITALETVRALRKKEIKITEDAVKEGVLNTVWHGRFEKIHSFPDFILDGAHNPAGAAALADSLSVYYPEGNMIFLMGIFKDKDVRGILDNTIKYAGEAVIIETPDNARALAGREFLSIIKQYYDIPVRSFDAIPEAVAYCFKAAAAGRNGIVSFGSLSNIKEIRKEVEEYDCRREGI